MQLSGLFLLPTRFAFMQAPGNDIISIKEWVLMEFGMILATRGVADYAEQSPAFGAELSRIFARYLRGDWGDVCQEDWEQNDYAVKAGERVLGSYNTSAGKVWIITEWDRSATTFLFPSEY